MYQRVRRGPRLAASALLLGVWVGCGASEPWTDEAIVPIGAWVVDSYEVFGAVDTGDQPGVAHAVPAAWVRDRHPSICAAGAQVPGSVPDDQAALLLCPPGGASWRAVAFDGVSGAPW